MLVPDGRRLIAEGDPAGTAFYDAAEVAGGRWLFVLTAVATAIAWGFANALVAQAATSRLLFSMARDRQLPSFLAKVHPQHRVPENATFLVAAVSIVVGVYFASRDDGATLLTTLVNFGALTAFLLLHVSVINHFFVRERSRDLWRHLVAPVLGFLIIGYVIIQANVAAQRVGLLWLALGAVVLGALLRHRPGAAPRSARRRRARGARRPGATGDERCRSPFRGRGRAVRPTACGARWSVRTVADRPRWSAAPASS